LDEVSEGEVERRQEDGGADQDEEEEELEGAHRGDRHPSTRFKEMAGPVGSCWGSCDSLSALSPCVGFYTCESRAKF